MNGADWIGKNQEEMAISHCMNKLLQRAFQFPVAIVMAAYYLLTTIVRPIIKPIMRSLARLRMLQILRVGIENLGPYPSLILLLVPVLIVEPLKIVALAIIDAGRPGLGIVVLLVAQGLSLLVVERLFEVVKPKVLTLRWFAVSWAWFTSLRDRLLAWYRSTWAWSTMLRIKNWSRAAIASLLSRKVETKGDLTGHQAMPRRMNSRDDRQQAEK